MRLPSVKTIKEGLSCDVGTAARIRVALETCRDSFLDTGRAVDVALQKCDTFLRGHGVEYLPSSRDTMREANGILYVNMGDPYVSTVYYDYDTGRFYVGPWGNVVELFPRRFDE